jgi:hypothetical protein
MSAFTRNRAGVIVLRLADMFGVRINRRRLDELAARLDRSFRTWESELEKEVGFHFIPVFDDPKARAVFWETFWRVYERSMEAPRPVVEIARDIAHTNAKDPIRADAPHPIWNIRRQIT